MALEKENKQYPVVTVLAYCGVLCFVPLFLHKGHPFVEFHTKQGIALFMIEVLAVFLASTIFTAPISILLFILCGIASIAGIIAVVKNKQTPLPLLSWMVEKLNI